ncbi:hypothetical protein T484DRAFT_1758256, partial [Baffinella frigidus]
MVMIDEVHSHVPRYLSDYYESVPRNTDEYQMLHLYDTGSKQPSIRGMDQPMRAAEFKASSTFELFPAVRFERKEPINSRLEDFNQFADTFAFKKKSREDVSKLAFAQFSDHQVSAPDFDHAYPSALHTTKDGVYVSVGNFRHLAQSKLRTRGNIECYACVKIRRETFPRWDTTDPPKHHRNEHGPTGLVPGMYHIDTTTHVRTLQDIINGKTTIKDDTTSTDFPTSPYLLLDQTEDDFKKIVLESLSLLFIKAVDITKDGENYGASDVPGPRRRAHDTPLKSFMNLIDKGVEFPFLSRVSKTERGVDSSGADHVKVNNDQLINEYIKLFPGEARLVYCAAKWPQLAKHWFEVYRHPQITSTVTRSNDKSTLPVDEPIPNSGVVAYEIGFNNNFKCIAVDETDHSKACNALHLGSRVYQNVVNCQVCTSVSEIICTGRNRCGIPEWLDSWTTKNKSSLDFGTRFTAFDKSDQTSPTSVIDIAWAILRTAIIKMLPRNPATNTVGLPIRELYSIKTSNDTVFGGAFQRHPLQWESW